MAVTSVWAIKGRVDNMIRYIANPEKTIDWETAESFHKIENAVQYTADELKTEELTYVSYINCTPNHAVEQFMSTKRNWGKLGGRACYHGIQSFKPGETTADEAHAIGVALAQELWGDRFEVVVATHCNTDCYHNHFVFNSVSFVDGYNAEVREREQQATAKELAVDIDRLCRDHIQGYVHTFPRADYQQEIIAARIMEGETYLFKTQLLNFKQPEATADTILRLDDFEKDRGIGTYMVYQLKQTDENHLLRFEALDRLYAAGKTVDPANYELVYAGPFTPGETLETIYRDLNVNHPEDYRGYSLSMSDVIVLREYGKDTAHYCDTIGFTEVPQFLNPQQAQEKENPLRTAEMTIEDDYGMIDGVINNGRRDEPQGKTSIRDRLEAAKKECSQQKPPERKHSGRDTPERSEP